jgi:hypothetical protein
LWFQNLDHDKEEELVEFMCAKNILAIQETWHLGSDITENNGFVVVPHTANREVEGLEELPAALLQFSVLLQRQRGLWLDRFSFILAKELLLTIRILAVRLNLSNAKAVGKNLLRGRIFFIGGTQKVK